MAMRHVEVNIRNHRFSLACDEGQEARLLQLADEVNSRAQNIALNQPKAKDAQIILMTCLMLADELYDARIEAGILHEKLASGINSLPTEDRAALQDALPGYVVDNLADALNEISERLGSLSRSVETARETII
ncbi:MAG: cell division protein ZapA [Rickettsiales bacterium]